jgi:hypothetical protein
MIKTGSIIIANTDHFDGCYGDIYIESGDKFEVVDIAVSTLTLKPEHPAKYPGESVIISHEEFFNEGN